MGYWVSLPCPSDSSVKVPFMCKGVMCLLSSVQYVDCGGTRIYTGKLKVLYNWIDI